MDQVERWPAPPLDLRAIVGECVRMGECEIRGRKWVEALAVADGHSTAEGMPQGISPTETSQGNEQSSKLQKKRSRQLLEEGSSKRSCGAGED